MRTKKLSISACRNCQHYKVEGRRGGQCQQLGVPVHGVWKACSLAIPAFASDWKNLEDVMLWQSETPELLTADHQLARDIPRDLQTAVATTASAHLAVTIRATVNGEVDESA
jgi:hypothetical protein